MDALRSFANGHRQRGSHVGLHRTPKLFFDRYPIKVEFDAQRLNRKTRAASQSFHHRQIHADVIAELGLSERVMCRRRDIFATVYLKDEDDALALCQRLGDTVLAITCPRDEQELSTLLGDGTRLKPVLRRTLFWGKYTYGLSLKASARKDEMYNEIREWVQMFAEMNEPESVYIDNGAPPRVYFKREEDVAYFKLVFHEQILNFEKTILIEDIADASGPLAPVC